MAKITANNILAGSISSDKLDASVASNLAAADNANTLATLATAVAAAAFATANTNAGILANSASPLITTIQIADSSYNVLDDTAANTTGGYVVITGSGFTNSSTVVFGSTAAPAVSYVDSTTLRAQVPALTAASYPVYVVNSNGGTGIRINGLTTSSFPAWGTNATLANTNAGSIFNVSLSANSDSSITYANTTVLPAGTTLAANGLFSGTITVGSITTYTFDVKATDAENQDASRTFSLTVTVNVPNLYSWGKGGLLGVNDTISRSSPIQVGTATNWNLISIGGYNSLATKSDGTLWAWGYGTRGQLGTNDRENMSSPIQVGTGTDWSYIDQGNQSTLAIKSNGTLWTWGWNDKGQSGTNDVVLRSSPVQIGTDTNWSKVFAGKDGNGNCSYAIKTNGTLWAWGDNTRGQLGINSRLLRSSPTQVGTLTNWSKVAGGNATIAIKTDGTLWAWGFNDNGNLGTNDRVSRSSPTQVGVGTTWLTVTSSYCSLAIKTDGTLWSWGSNVFGSLGQSDKVYRSSPTQIGTDTNWSKVSGGLAAGMTKTNGTLWMVGYNSYGALGINDSTSKSSPVQIGTNTNWYNIQKGLNLSMATITQP